jgi:hypothetical protein
LRIGSEDILDFLSIPTVPTVVFPHLVNREVVTIAGRTDVFAPFFGRGELVQVVVDVESSVGRKH